MRIDLRSILLQLLVWLTPIFSASAQPGGNQDLISAVKTGDVNAVTRLLDHGADVNAVDDSQRATALFYAADSQSTAIAELLIARGANVNAADRWGFTPLHRATYWSRLEIAELLVLKGANVNAKSVVDRDGGWTPLHKAMERLATPDSHPSFNQLRVTPSDTAAMIGIVELLLAKGADVNARSAMDDTPLLYAASAGHKALFESLIAKGAEIHHKSKVGVTALHMAAKADRREVAELLIAKGVDVNAKTKSGYTPLINAATEGSKEVGKLLLDRGADANSTDANGHSALFHAVNQLSVAYSFMATTPAAALKRQQSGLDTKTLEWAKTLFRKKLERLRELAILLLNRTDNVNIEAECDTPLYFAATIGDKNLVEMLISKGANVNGARCAVETPLHSAIAEKHGDVAALLIRGKANVNARNISGRTPLHFLAAHIDDPKLAELMIEHGADVNAKDKEGDTPLDFAMKVGNGHVAGALRKRANI